METQFLKNLIDSNNPTELFFQQLLKFGVRLTDEDLKTFYYKLESEIKGLEEFLFQTYGEYCQLPLPKS